MNRAVYLDLTAQGLRMPIGTHLVLAEKADDDACLRDVVLFGPFPTKRFYSENEMPACRVTELASDPDRRMKTTGHPFILGSECDVLDVPAWRAPSATRFLPS